jgi:endonuclease IV
MLITFQFCHVHAERIALVEDSFPATLNEFIKPDCELRHTLSKVVESEVDAGKAVRHGPCTCTVL